MEPNNTVNRPNIVVIMADDQIRSDLSVTGGNVLTPNINKLAEDGIYFENAHVPTAVCVPSRYTLLTGQDPSRAPRTLSYARDQLFYDQLTSTFDANEVPTIAQILQAGGYRTGMVGKLHWKPGAPSPTYEAFISDAKAYGFDYAASLYNGNNYNYHNQDWINAGAQTFLNGVSANEPFFLFVSTTLQHSNSTIAELGGSDLTQATWDDDVLTNTYAKDLGSIDPNAILNPDEVRQNRDQIRQDVINAGLDLETADSTWLDDGVGKILQQLNDQGLAENTLVIYLNDNGREGGKGTVYEAGTNVAMMFYWKGKTEQLADSEIYAQSSDIVPTILDLAQVANPDQFILDGESLAPLLNGEDFNKQQNYAYTGIGHTRSITKDGLKYVAFRLPDDVPDGTTPLNDPSIDSRNVWISPKTIASTYPHYLDGDQLYDLGLDLNFEDPQSSSYDWREQTNQFDDPAYQPQLGNLQRLLAKHLTALPGSFGEFDYEVNVNNPIQIDGNLDLSADYNAISLAEDQSPDGDEYTVIQYSGDRLGTFEIKTQISDAGYRLDYSTPGEVRLIKNSQTLDQKILGGQEADNLVGGAGKDTILGFGGNDTLIGNVEDDRLIGGSGKNTLEGGQGRDRFIFKRLKGSFDLILDFNPQDDLMLLKQSAFTGLTEKGRLRPNQFSIGTSASTPDPNIIYNPTTGILKFDPDGNRGEAATAIALLSPFLNLSERNIRVI